MRTSLYEQLKLQKISFIGEMQKINELIYGKDNLLLCYLLYISLNSK